ncbi:MAG TPA: hypothetical protein VF884_10870 [Nitrososphaeraceae archaeon]
MLVGSIQKGVAERVAGQDIYPMVFRVHINWNTLLAINNIKVRGDRCIKPYLDTKTSTHIATDKAGYHRFTDYEVTI